MFSEGGLYLGMFALGLVDPELFGLLPSGVGIIDQALHLVGGIAAFVLPILLKKGDKLAV